MTRTPDEIKKGLECRLCDEPADLCGEDCPCWSAYSPREMYEDKDVADALALIQHLQTQNDTITESFHRLKKVVVEQGRTIMQLEAERDAAVADVRLAYTSYVGACQTCKRVKDQVDCDNPLGCGHCGEEKCKCNSCDNDYSNWEWRGVQKEDGNETN